MEDMAKWVAKTEALNDPRLLYVFAQENWPPEVLVAIANNPRTEDRTLKVLAESQYRTVSKAALDQLAAREELQRKREQERQLQQEQGREYGDGQSPSFGPMGW